MATTYEQVREMTGNATKSRTGLVVSIIDPYTGQPYRSDADGNLVLTPGSSGVSASYAKFIVHIMNNTSLRYDVFLEQNGQTPIDPVEPMRVPPVGSGDNTWEINGACLGQADLLSPLNAGWQVARNRLMTTYAYTTDTKGLIKVRIIPEYQDKSMAASLSAMRQHQSPDSNFDPITRDYDRELAFLFKTFAAPAIYNRRVKPLSQPVKKTGVTLV